MDRFSGQGPLQGSEFSSPPWVEKKLYRGKENEGHGLLNSVVQGLGHPTRVGTQRQECHGLCFVTKLSEAQANVKTPFPSRLRSFPQLSLSHNGNWGGTQNLRAWACLGVGVWERSVQDNVTISQQCQHSRELCQALAWLCIN